MQIHVPVVIKQKCGILARSAYLKYVSKETQPDTPLQGHAEISGPIDIPGITVTPLVANHATISLPISKLEELVRHGNLSHFELAGVMA